MCMCGGEGGGKGDGNELERYHLKHAYIFLLVQIETLLYIQCNRSSRVVRGGSPIKTLCWTKTNSGDLWQEREREVEGNNLRAIFNFTLISS